MCLDIILAIFAIPSRCLSRPSLEKSLFAKKSLMVSPSSTSHPNLSAYRHCYGCLAGSREPCEPNYPVTHLVPFRMYPEIGSLFHCDGRVLSGYDHHSAPSSLDDLIDSRMKLKMRATSLSTSRVSSLISSSPFRSLITTNS